MNLFKNQKSTVFACFSPAVMIATVIIELALAAYTIVKHRQTLWGKLIIALLVFLATFQLAEYMVCEVGNELLWSRIGFVAITLLPPLAISLIYALAKQPMKKSFHIFPWVVGLYLVGAFAFSPASGIDPTCNGNYVIFHYNYEMIGRHVFPMYYGLTLLLGIWLADIFARNAKDEDTKKSLRLMIMGYLVFILPAALVIVAVPKALYAAPSILCGFAVFFALILVLGIAPHADKSLKKK